MKEKMVKEIELEKVLNSDDVQSEIEYYINKWRIKYPSLKYNDLKQECMLNCWIALHEWDSEKSKANTYLKFIIITTCETFRDNFLGPVSLPSKALKRSYAGKLSDSTTANIKNLMKPSLDAEGLKKRNPTGDEYMQECEDANDSVDVVYRRLVKELYQAIKADLNELETALFEGEFENGKKPKEIYIELLCQKNSPVKNMSYNAFLQKERKLRENLTKYRRQAELLPN